MRYMFSRQQGVTLLEIMLVLAIAAIIIVLSVRYYQTTTTAQQANAFLAQLQAIQTAVDQLAESTHSYENIRKQDIAQLLGNNWNITPWGGRIVFDSIYGNRIMFRVRISPSICRLILPTLEMSKRWGSRYTGDRDNRWNYPNNICDKDLADDDQLMLYI